MSPDEYLKHTLGSAGTSLPWLLPLLYVLLALTLVSWAGLRHSNRSRRGTALFVFTIGIVLIVLASAFFFLRAVRATRLGGGRRGRHAARLRNAGRCRRVTAAQRRRLVRRAPRTADHSAAAHRAGPSAARRRHRGAPRGPLVFRVAERMSLISDALFLEASAADAAGDESRSTPSAPCLALNVDDSAIPPISSRRRCHRRTRRWRSRNGSTKDGTKRENRPMRHSRAWVGCASRVRTPTANGSWRSHISTECWTAGVTPPDRSDGLPNFAGRGFGPPGGLSVQLLPATQLVDLLDDVLLGLR